VVQDNEVEKAVVYVDKEFEHLFVSDVKNGPNAISYNIADIKGITAHAVIETRLLIDTGRKVIEIQVSSLKFRDQLVRYMGSFITMEQGRIETTKKATRLDESDKAAARSSKEMAAFQHLMVWMVQ
jgi:hypothetical protein